MARAKAKGSKPRVVEASLGSFFVYAHHLILLKKEPLQDLEQALFWARSQVSSADVIKESAEK